MSRGSFVLHMVSRYLRSARASRRGSTALSILGVAAGVMTLVAVTGVMNGFQLGFIEDIVEVSSYHLQIEGPALSAEAVDRLESAPGVLSITRFRDGQALAGTEGADLRGIAVRGIDAAAALKDPGFVDHLTMLSGAFGEGGIVMGAELAYSLGVDSGDTVRLLTLSTEGPSLATKWDALVVTGVFRTGYFDFDTAMAFVSLEAADGLFGSAARTTYGVKIRDRFADLRVAAELRGLLGDAPSGPGRVVSTWRDFNRGFFAALRLEKVLMFVLPGLIFVVVAFSIYHSLRRSVYERREELALLGALGATRRAVRAVCVLEGSLIGLAGALPGLCAGLAVSANVNRIFGWVETLVNGALGLVELAVRPLAAAGRGEFSIFSPTLFYLSEVPSRVPLVEALGITAAGVACAAAAALLASRRITRLEPATVLRHE